MKIGELSIADLATSKDDFTPAPELLGSEPTAGITSDGQAEQKPNDLANAE